MRLAMEGSKAASAFGQSVKQASDELSGAVLEVREFQDAGALANIKMKTMEVEELHKQFRKESIMEETWGSDWEGRVKEVEEYAGQFNLLPKSRVKAEQFVSRWARMSSLGVFDAMRTQSLNRAAQDITNTMQELIRQERYGEAKDLVPSFPQMLPEDQEAMVAKIDQQEEAAIRARRLVEYANFGPGEFDITKDLLDLDPDFLDHEKVGILKKMEAHQDKMVAEAQAGILERVDGPTGEGPQIATEKDLLDAMPFWMPVEEREKFRRNWEARLKPLTAREQATLQELVDGLNKEFHVKGKPVDLETYLAKRDKVARQLQPFALRPGARPYMASFGRTTVDNQRARLENLQIEWNKVTEAKRAAWLDDQVDVMTAALDDMMSNPVRE